MSFISIIQFGLVGVSMGAVYALIALGFTTIFRASNIVNFAQGEFVMLGSLFTLFLIRTCHFSYFPSAFLAILGVVLVGVCLKILVINPIRRAGILIIIMGTVGASVVIQNAFLPLSFVPGFEYLRDPFLLPPVISKVEAIELAGVWISVQRLLAIIASVITLCILYFFSNYTRTGKAMESCSTDRLGAQLVGIQVERMVLLSFAISATVGAIGGIITAPILNMRYDSGTLLGLKGFIGAVLGGWGKISGAVVGGITLGIVESLCIGLIPEYGSKYQQMWAFLILICILYFRPQGILGSKRRD